MKIKYEFVNETKEIEIDENTGQIIKDLDRAEYNNRKKETRRHCSIEKSLEFGTLGDDTDLEQTVIHDDDLKKLNKALATLTADQKDLVRRVFFYGEQLKDIAAEYGVSYQAIQDRLNKIMKRLRKNF